MYDMNSDISYVIPPLEVLFSGFVPSVGNMHTMHEKLLFICVD